jgi:alcohol dehydrogenase
MLPQYYEFQNSAKLLSGCHAIDNIPYELSRLEAEKPMVLSDAVLEKLGTMGIVTKALEEAGVTIGAVFTDIPADSSVEVVNRVAALYRETGCNSIVAVGGGSVIDTAKGARMVLSQDSDDILALMGCETLTRGKSIPFVAVPTTSGTGSEATEVAVIRDPARKLKMEFISHYLLPDVAVLDPRMTTGLPPKTTAATGMDALCHAVEGCTCLQNNPVSFAYGTAAIDLIRDNLETAVRNGKDETARQAMANASYLAGACFSNSMVGMVHAIGHALGGVCRVPHGEAMTILLPACMAYNLEKLDRDYGELLLHLAGPEVYAATPADQRGRKAIDAVRDLRHRLHDLCGLPETLRERGVDKADFDRVAHTALDDGAIIVNPCAVGLADVLKILEEVY